MQNKTENKLIFEENEFFLSENFKKKIKLWKYQSEFEGIQNTKIKKIEFCECLISV